MEAEKTEGEGQEQKTLPMIDEAKLGELVSQKLEAGLRTFWQNQQAEQQAAEQQRQAQEQAQKDSFGQLLMPYVKPVVDNLGFQAEDTKDYVKFYMEHPEAAAHRDTIEAKFVEMAKSGRAIPREDVHRWIVGRERLEQDRDAAAEKAKQASLINSGVAQRDVLLTKDPWSMTQEERLQVLDRISF